MIFNEEGHTYHDRYGREFVAVTKICGITPRHPDFSRVNPTLMESAIKRGKAIHKEAEEYFNYGLDGVLPTTEWLANNIAPKYKHFLAETIVYDDNEILPYAGTVDLIAENDDEVALMDIKTGGHETVDYQLSLYKRAYCKLRDLPEERVSLYLIDFKDEPKLVPVKPIPNEWLENLLYCYSRGREYTEPNIVPVPEEEIEKFGLLEVEIVKQKKIVEDLQAQREALKNALIPAMLEAGVNSFETDKVKVTLIPSSVRKTFDTKRVSEFIKSKGEDPDSFKNSTLVDPTLRIKLK